ncbi:short-chain dehydrogenase/reductase family protein, putative [Talaromyces marneffei ATCC 18224]|uniref:Short-chain dehydrogenase/reductase family protein, putative n=1 Tax=Talaromyces marneffei (strain ATCC 18224 / CBS 334.59 / QM 7333) TaxID=441960 RepID=B6QH64_TALMQ|nr:short-chain dehydrogenase/reductase family protein, putative [Talaromyces marneffei ATCC 18224]
MASSSAPRSTLSQDIGAALGLTAHGLRNPAELWTAVGPTMNELTWGLIGHSFDPSSDIPDLPGKVIFVTGGTFPSNPPKEGESMDVFVDGWVIANTGLGKETVLQLARHNPARIYLAARNEQKAENAIRSIRQELSATGAGTANEVDIQFIQLDLTSFSSIRQAAETFLQKNTRLDILVLNAGVMAEPAITTPQGHEIQFGTNHIGHFLLTELLLPTLLKTASPSPGETSSTAPDVRIVVLTSLASSYTPYHPDYMQLISSPERLLELTTWQRYAISKAANILFATELARRYPSITSVSVHPGLVASDLYNGTQATNAIAGSMLPSLKLLFRSVRSGTLNQLWAAAGARKDELVNGAYYTPVGHRNKRNRFVVDTALAKRLWEWTEKEVERF